MYKSYIIEGIDNLGKSLLVKNIQNKLGFFQVIHFQKPEFLDCYITNNKNNNTLAQKQYQYTSFKNGFKLLETELPFIFDRGHLGENVYAHRYRGYDGSYVFDLEESFLYPNGITKPKIESPVKLILLTTSDFSFVQDDEKSFDYAKKEEEQRDFFSSFYRCNLPKVLIDVANRKGGFKQQEDILEQALYEETV